MKKFILTITMSAVIFTGANVTYAGVINNDITMINNENIVISEDIIDIEEMRFVVDRIEGNVVVLISDNGKEYHLNQYSDDNQFNQSDVLGLSFDDNQDKVYIRVLEDEKQRRVDRINELMSRLLNK